MILSSVLAIPAGAYRIGRGDSESGNCTCGIGIDGSYANLIDSNDKEETWAATSLGHNSTACSSASTYVSAKFWHYPSASSSAYNTTIRTNTAYGKISSAKVSAKENGMVIIPGEIFCIESNHRITTVCSGTTYTYSKYLCAGEPALK